ncbi:MAG: Ig-like domain repeat protein [Solirubrobacterales bacterium]|nr:Ig-like domain repeat protein [Solirubrobacterales bacterium]
MHQRCPALGVSDGLFARSTTLGLTVPHGRGSGWRFDAPRGTSVVGVDWAGEYRTRGSGWQANMAGQQGSVFGCGPAGPECSRRWVTGARFLHREIAPSQWLEMGVTCVTRPGCRGGDSRGNADAQFATWFLRVRVNDPSPPTLTATGPALENKWVKPGTILDLDAKDASGVSDLRLLSNGVLASDAPQPCDIARPRPCADQTAQFSVSSPGSGEGLMQLSAVARDAAGNEAKVERTVGIDGTAPTVSSAPEVEGGESWRTSNVFHLSWDIPNEVGRAPIENSRLEVCSGSGSGLNCLAPQDFDPPTDRKATAVVTVPQRGDWIARISVTDAAGNSSSLDEGPAAHLRFDDEAPATPSVLGPVGWITRERARLIPLNLRLPDDQSGPISGVTKWSWFVGSDPTFAQMSDGILALLDLPEGISQISIRAISGSGVRSRQSAVVPIRIDETPPTASLSGPSGHWESSPTEVTASGRDQAALSGMGGADGSLAGVRMWLDGELAASDPGSETRLTIDTDGIHQVTAEAKDAAGNTSGRVLGQIMLDRTPPERVVFLPQDVSDPRVVRVDATDATSGITAVTVRMRPISGGEWRPLSLETVGSRATGMIDDSGLPAGLWELEATAVDAAGNKSTTDRTVTRDPALVALPLRGPSRIEAGVGQFGSGLASASTSVTIPHSGESTLNGRILDRDDLPVAGAVVTAESQLWLTGASWEPLSTGVTDRSGRFSFHLAHGPSRHLRLTYSGSRRDLQTSTLIHVRVAARSSLGVSPRTVRVGRTAVFSGGLDGGHLPSGGKLVLLQASIPRRGWQTFAVARANPEGRWSVGYRFRTAVGRVNYSIRAVVPSESSYPFTPFTSRPIVVTAVG